MASSKSNVVVMPLRGRVGICDEYGELSRRVAEFQPVLDRKKALEREIQDWYSTADPTSTFVEDGNLYSVQVGARRRERFITSLPKLFLHLGKSKFLSFATFPFAALDKLLMPDVQTQFVAEARTGPRRVEAVAKGSPLQLRAA